MEVLLLFVMVIGLMLVGVPIAVVRTPVLEPGAMVRKGAVGAARDDGMTPEIAEHLQAVGTRICPDKAAVEWFYDGGPLPDPR